MAKKINKIPEFASPEEEKAYWDAKATSAQKRKSRSKKEEKEPKLEAELSVPMSAAEIARLYQLSVTLGTDVTRLAREALLSFMNLGRTPASFPSPTQMGRTARARPRSRQVPDDNTMLDEPDFVTRLIYEKGREEDDREAEEPANSHTGDDMTTLIREGTGGILTPDEREYFITADYKIQENLWEAQEGGGWSGELVMMSEIPPGEYILQLELEDGRSGRIILQEAEKMETPGLNTYKYKFTGEGPLINEWMDLK